MSFSLHLWLNEANIEYESSPLCPFPISRQWWQSLGQLGGGGAGGDGGRGAGGGGSKKTRSRRNWRRRRKGSRDGSVLGNSWELDKWVILKWRFSTSILSLCIKIDDGGTCANLSEPWQTAPRVGLFGNVPHCPTDCWQSKIVPALNQKFEKMWKFAKVCFAGKYSVLGKCCRVCFNHVSF